MRKAELREEQSERAGLDVPAAARVESCSGPGAAWVSAAAGCGADFTELAVGASVEGPVIRHADRFVVPDEEAKALCRFRLGLFKRGGPCGRKTATLRAKKRRCDCIEASARHRVTCPCGPWAINRHNRLARLLQLLVLEIPGASARWTPRTAFWRRGAEAGEPDLLLDLPGRRQLYIDVAVVFPYSSAPGRAARLAEGSKEAAYPVWVEQARAVSRDFSPCVFEAFGRCGEGTWKTIRALASLSAEARGLPPAEEVRRWISLLSLRLQLDQADILLNS